MLPSRVVLAVECLRSGEGRKEFFFEKKNQKTFARFDAYRSFLSRQPTSKSFLVLFFKKELLPSF